MVTRKTWAKLARVACENPEIRLPLTRILIKHAKDWPQTTDIYPNKIDHGYGEPLSGGTDVMRKVQNQLRHEQGLPTRPESDPVPKAAGYDDLPRTDMLRRPYYEMTDGLYSLRQAILSTPELRGDKQLVGFMKKVMGAATKLERHMSANYRWD